MQPDTPFTTPTPTYTVEPPTPPTADPLQSMNIAHDALEQEATGVMGIQIYADICAQIIAGQQEIIGELAVDQAKLVDGLSVSYEAGQIHCTLSAEPVSVIDKLIAQYQDFFGHAAVEVCKEAVSHLLIKLQQTEIPASLR